MSKIKNEHELQVSRKAVKRLRRALEGIKTIQNPDIRQMCADSTHIMLAQIEREIEEYLTQKTVESSVADHQSQPHLEK